MTTSIASTRLDEETERRVDATAERRRMTRSDWIRQAIMRAIDAETQAADQAPAFVDIAKRFKLLERNLGENRDVADRVLGAITDLSNTLAIERAADRAVAQQIYRMALRAAYLGIKGFTDDIPDEQRDELGMKLCEQADEVYRDDGLKRLDDEMREARKDLRQNIDRVGSRHGKH